MNLTQNVGVGPFFPHIFNCTICFHYEKPIELKTVLKSALSINCNLSQLPRLCKLNCHSCYIKCAILGNFLVILQNGITFCDAILAHVWCNQANQSFVDLDQFSVLVCISWATFRAWFWQKKSPSQLELLFQRYDHMTECYSG